jgi:hypothetical protein
MSVKFGIYELVSFTIPGFVYLIAGLYFSNSFFGTHINLDLFNFKLIQLVIYVALSFIIGQVSLIFSEYYWRFVSKIFRINNLSDYFFKQFKKRNRNFNIDFKITSWYTLKEVLNKEVPDSVEEIERVNAARYMLRNLSFGLLILSFALFAVAIKNQFPCFLLLLGLLFLALSFICLFAQFRLLMTLHWLTYDTLVARSLTINDISQITWKTGNKE